MAAVLEAVPAFCLLKKCQDQSHCVLGMQPVWGSKVNVILSGLNTLILIRLLLLFESFSELDVKLLNLYRIKV